MNEQKLATIRALLAKAESTTYAEEAEALTAKAQELMTRYAIDEAMLAKASGDRSKIIRKSIKVYAPYSEAKSSLLFAISRANDCQAVYYGSPKLRIVDIVGYESDIEFTETLFTSLLVQQAKELGRAIRHKASHVHGKTFTNSFMLGYASEVQRRLQESKRAATASYEATTGTSTALVLRDKKQEVDREYNRLFPNTRTKTNNSSINGGAYGAGREAGARASFGGQSVGSNRGALNK